MLFSSIRSQIDRDYTRYEAKCKKNSDNANQRWHGNEANASDNMRTDANYAKEKENEKNSISYPVPLYSVAINELR